MTGTMKGSGVEWIGEIPEEWETKKLKYCCNLVIDKVSADSENNEDLMFVGMEHVESQKGCFESSYEPIYDFQGEGMRFAKGDVLFGKLRPYLAKVLLAKDNGKCSPEFFVLRAQPNIVPDFLKFGILSKGFIDYVDSTTFGVKMPRADWELVGNTRFMSPDSSKQLQIASFLNEKCSEIDAVIAAKQKQNELLKKQRQSIIYEAVTKGLDTNVKYKDSGVEWIGEIPEDWGTQKVKYTANLKSGEIISSQNIAAEGIYPVYGGNGLRGYTDAITHDGTYILIGRQGALCGNVHLVEGQFWASEHAIVVTVEKRCNVAWLALCLEVMNLNQYSESAAQPGISVDRVSNLFVPQLPEEEQHQIAATLTIKCAEIDAVISSNDAIIAKLKEYRQSIIYEAVTGKIAV